MPAWCWSPSRAPIPPRSRTRSRGTRRRDAVVVSLQNGVGNASVLRERLPGRTVLAAMVPFNVIAARRGAISSRHLGRYRDRAGRRPTPPRGFRCRGLTMRADRRHRRRAMGQAARQSQQCAQCAVRPAAAPAARAARLARCCSPTRSPKGLTAVRAEGIKPVSPTPMPLSLDAASAAAA